MYDLGTVFNQTSALLALQCVGSVFYQTNSVV